jgi:hypothetical protein
VGTTQHVKFRLFRDVIFNLKTIYLRLLTQLSEYQMSYQCSRPDGAFVVGGVSHSNSCGVALV